MSSARFLAAAVAIYVIAISVGIAVWLVFWDSLEGLSERLKWSVAARQRPAGLRRAQPLRLRVRLVLRARLVRGWQAYEAALTGLVVGLRRWRRLSAARLVQIGVAIGAVAYGKKELGLERFDRLRTWLAAVWAPRLRRVAWVSAGALAGVVLAVAAVATHDFGSSGRLGAKAFAKPRAVPLSLGGLLYPPRTALTRNAAAQARSHLPERVTRPIARSSTRVQQTPAGHPAFVSSTVQAGSAGGAPAAGKTFAPATPHSAGAGPLRAPKGASAPGPLKAP